jgi:hypothetical protein
MDNKQTAVEWFIDWLMDNPIISDGYIEAMTKAKAIEKEQIKDAWTDGCIGELYELNAYYTSEKYYNQTYGPQVDKE